MSTVFVDNLKPNLNTGVNIPGHVIQTVQFLRRGGLAAESDRPQGSILQLNTSSYADVMTKSIVTKAENSQIYVIMSAIFYDGSNNTRARCKVLRDSTVINSDEYAVYCPSNIMIPYLVHMLDSPNVPAGTTLTYKMQAARQSGSSTGLFAGYADSGGGSSASIVLMEIGQ